MSDRMTDENKPTADSQATAADDGAGLDMIEVRRERDDYLEQLQRTRAEFANFQKRSRAQAEADRPYAIVSLATDLLPVVDNLERALEAGGGGNPAGLLEGIGMVHKQLLAALAKHGVEPIAALDQPFDPAQHEALTQQAVADRPEGTVVGEHGKGYRLRDRVLRPARVAVSVRPES